MVTFEFWSLFGYLNILNTTYFIRVKGKLSTACERNVCNKWSTKEYFRFMQNLFH